MSSKLRVRILSLNEKGWIKAFLGTPQKPKREPNTPAPIGQRRKENALYPWMHLISLLKNTCPILSIPKSAVEGATSGRTKLTAALVHGFGESAYYYWTADQVCHDTNLTAHAFGVRVLLRIADLNKLKGDVPLFILTAGDASDNKSSHFLAFIIYQVVEMKVLDLLKGELFVRWLDCYRNSNPSPNMKFWVHKLDFEIP